MAKFSGKIGYAVTGETSPGIWAETITEYSARGDLLNSSYSMNNSDKVNTDISLSNRISIVASAKLHEQIHNLRYVTINGIKWTIESVELAPPRIILTTGGVWNGE